MEPIFEFLRDGVASGVGKALVIGAAGAGVWGIDVYVSTFENKAVIRSAQYTDLNVAQYGKEAADERARIVKRIDEVEQRLSADIKDNQRLIIEEIRSSRR